MKQYYAMITPGRCSDWGELILIDKTVGSFVTEVAGYFNEEDLEKLKDDFTAEQWQFLKEEFETTHLSDIDFIKSVTDNYDSNMSDNYYLFSELNSTLSFGSVTAVINYVQTNKISVVGDFT